MTLIIIPPTVAVLETSGLNSATIDLSINGLVVETGLTSANLVDSGATQVEITE